MQMRGANLLCINLLDVRLDEADGIVAFFHEDLGGLSKHLDGANIKDYVQNT